VKVGVVVPVAVKPTGGYPTFSELKQYAQTAEASGLDSIWLFDHLIYRHPDRPESGMWECFTTWSALAAVTSRIELGTLVLCTAFRNPAVTAKMAVTLDAISGGRIILGLGAGWHQPEFDAFDLRFDHRVGQFEEAMKIIAPLVREGYVDFQGEFHNAVDCAMLPKPDREIPILIASKGPRMLGLTAEFADQWNAAWFGKIDGFLTRRDELHEAIEAALKPQDAVLTTAGLNVNFPDLGEANGPIDPERVFSGSADELLELLEEFAAAGCGHAIINLNPCSVEAIERVAEVRARLSVNNG
jgi:alkanesulfonate monooxygenase SsuD/methylene tetrahydromethanopterin reductase-like flavin-dependent oxidoreductase (luciferase family)